MREVGAFEAKSRLGQLLDQVVVAHMVPPGMTLDRKRGRQAVARIREMRAGVTLGGVTIKDLIGEGRL